MRKKSIRCLIIAVVFFVFIVASVLVFFWVSRLMQASRDLAAFKGSKEIVFTTQGKLRVIDDQPYEYEQISILSSNDIARIVSTIQLNPKPQCKCGHLNKAVFDAPSGRITVSFCDHCFDILDQSNRGHSIGTRHYEMPKEFYAEFQQISINKGSWKPLTLDDVRD
jgi:hypothetical protein